MTEKATKKNVFVGREEELETIENIIRDNPKANILISGVTGMGKTELAIRVKELLSQDKSLHCGSHRVESKLEDPVNPFLVALAEVFGSITQKETAKSKLKWFTNVFAKKTWEKRKDIGIAMVKDGLGTILKNIKEKVELDETTSALTDILKDASSEWSTKSTLEQLLVENQPAVISIYLGLLRQVSEQSPNGHKFVLILDQVENTSEVFQEFLKSTARNLPEKFYLIFALNNEVPEGVDFLKEHKADLRRFKTKPVELTGLSNFEIRKLIEEMRGVYKAPDEVEKIRRLADGRPLMIIQWINSEDFDLSVIDEEKLSLYGYYGDNLNAAGSDAKKLATVLSLLPFPLKGGLSDYARIMGIRNFECNELLEELESKNIFRKYPEGCWFSHGLIKDYVFNNMDEAIKKDAALQIIKYLKKKYKEEIEAHQLTGVKTVYAGLLPFTDDYQAAFKENHYLAMYHYRISSYEVAKEYFGNALRATRELKDRQKEGSTLNNMGMIYDAWGKYDQANQYYKKSLKIRQEVGDRKAKGTILNNIGEIHRTWGKYDEAIEYYKKSLKTIEGIGDWKQEAATLNNIANVYYAWRSYHEAMDYYRMSLKIIEETGDRQGEGVTLNNIGLIHKARGNYEQAIEYYRRSLQMSEEIGDRKQEGVSLHNIASVYHAWEKYDQAIELFKKTLKIRKDVGDRIGEGVTLNNIGMVYKAQGKYDQAIEFLNKSLKIKEDVKDRLGEGVTLNNIGLIYKTLGKYDEAIKYCKKSLKVLEEIGTTKAEMPRENLKHIKERIRNQ